MHFDALCGYAERFKKNSSPKTYRIISDAALFTFGTEDGLSDEVDDDCMSSLAADFFLPFESVAVEDSVSCVMVSNTEKGQTGTSKPRFFIEAQKFSDGGGYVFAFGFFHAKSDHGRLGVAPVIMPGANHFRAFDGSWNDVTSEWMAVQDLAELQAHMVDNTWNTIKRMILVNTPNRFVVEQVNAASTAKEKKNGRIKRSHERPTYTLLTVPEIRKVISEPAGEPTGRTVASHQRRRHWRTLNSEKFVNKRGEKILIPATWVGPSEAVVGSRRYKVRLDL